MQMNWFRNRSRVLRGLIAGLLWTGLSVFGARSVAVLPNLHSRPAGKRHVGLSLRPDHHPCRNPSQPHCHRKQRHGVRAKAIALNPNPLLTAIAPPPSLPRSQGGDWRRRGLRRNDRRYLAGVRPDGHANGSPAGIAYTQDGNYLLFSQDNSYVTVASVGADGTLTSKLKFSSR